MRKWFGWSFILCLIPLFLFLLLGSGQAVEKLKSIPETLDEKLPIEEVPAIAASYIKDAEGSVVSELATDGQKRLFVQSSDIPSQMKELFLKSEDQRFYEHAGFDFEGTARALLVNVKNQSLDQGGSTITQQLARNLYLNHERTYNRKLSELLLSIQLERKWSKDKILESYLNTIYFQNGVYGVGAAADFYFSKPLQALTTAEMAYLASIPNNPTLYDPLTNPKKTKKRQERLLQMLKESGILSEQQLTEEKNRRITLSIRENKEPYPDYTGYVENELSEAVAQKEKLTDPDQIQQAKEDWLRSGIVIETHLDPFLQDRIYKANEKFFDGSHESAAVILDHENHHIEAISGGYRYKQHDYNRAFQATRQPGSAIKPLIDYVPYIEETKADPASKISADRFCISKNNCPENYTKKEYGMVTLEKAFSQSYNTPALRMFKTVGYEKAYHYLKPFKFKKAAPVHDYSAALGGGTLEVSPLELAGAYTAFGNDGMYQPSRAIKRILAQDGSVLFEWKDTPVRAWSSGTNSILLGLLESVIDQGTGKKAAFESAYLGGKTGTTNNYNDLWFSGLTNRHTAAVWFGKDQNGSIENVYEKGTLLEYWKMIMGGESVGANRK